MPRKIIGAAFVSLDGVMQAPGGPSEDPTGGFAYGGWLEPLADDAIEGVIGRLFTGDFDLLLGRRTYDIFAAYWPYADPADPIAASFARAGKYVLTGSDHPLEWQGSHRLDGIDAIAALKAGEGPNLVIQGSSTLYPQLIAQGLIDRLTLMIAPLVLGSGKRLFGDGTAPTSWRLTEWQIGSGGVIAASYEPAGPVRTGSFVMHEPSAREQQRQQAIAEGRW